MPSLSFQTCWFLWTIRGLKHNGHFLLLLADEIPPESAEELFSCFWMWLWKAAAFLKYLIVWKGQPEAQHLYRNFKDSFDGTIGIPSLLYITVNQNSEFNLEIVGEKQSRPVFVQPMVVRCLNRLKYMFVFLGFLIKFMNHDNKYILLI